MTFPRSHRDSSEQTENLENEEEKQFSLQVIWEKSKHIPKTQTTKMLIIDAASNLIIHASDNIYETSWSGPHDLGHACHNTHNVYIYVIYIYLYISHFLFLYFLFTYTKFNTFLHNIICNFIMLICQLAFFYFYQLVLCLKQIWNINNIAPFNDALITTELLNFT